MENYITNELIESTYLFCAKRISDSEAAMDLSQDILLTAMQNISMGKQFVSFNSWYWRMARNKYADLIEARQKCRELPLDEALDVRDMSVQPIDAMISHEQLSRLNFALSRLAEIYREIIIRFYLKEQPIRQIAQELDIPVGTVKRRLFDAKTQLRERMEDMNNTGRTAYALAKTEYHNAYNSGYASSVLQSSKICPQVMVLCRSEAKTLNELSDELGVAPVFLEEFLDNMIDAGLVRMPAKDKLIANHCVFPESAYNKAEKYAADVFQDGGFAERVHNAIKSVEKDIRALGFYGNDFEFGYLLWELYKIAAYHIATIGTRHYAKKFGDKYPDDTERGYFLTLTYTLPDEDFTPEPIRTKSSIDMWNNLNNGCIFCGNEPNKDGQDIRHYSSDRIWWIDEGNIGLIFDLADDPKKVLNEKEEEQAAFLLECGILKKQDGGLKVMLPIFTSEQHGRKYDILEAVIKDIACDYVDAVTPGIEKILLPYIRKDLMGVFVRCDIWFFLFATSKLYYYGWDKTLTIPESFENSAAGLYLVKDFHFLERPKDE